MRIRGWRCRRRSNSFRRWGTKGNQRIGTDVCDAVTVQGQERAIVAGFVGALDGLGLERE